MATSLQSQQQQKVTTQQTDANYLLAQEILAKQQQQQQQQSGLALPTQGLTALETLAALQNQPTQAAKPATTLPSLPSTGGSSNLEYLTKIYLQTIAAKKELTNYSAALQQNKLINSALASSTATEKLSSPGSASNLLPSNGTHLCNGIDYRLCPCTSCQTLRLNVWALQQNLNKTTQQVNKSPTQPQQHYLLPQTNPLTGTVQYVSVCSDQANCSVCTKPTHPTGNNNHLSSQPQATSPTGLTAEQYLAALTGQSQSVKLPTTPSPKPSAEKASPDFSAPLQIRTSPSPTIQEIVPNDITCSWTEHGAPCGRKFTSEEQLFDHIKKVHTSCQASVSSQNVVPKQPSPLNGMTALPSQIPTETSPLASLKNLSRKVLPEPASSRYHPYARPSLHDSRLTSLTNQIAARQASAVPLLPTALNNPQLPLGGALGALGLPSVQPQATAGLPFSFPTNQSSHFVSANQMSSLLFAAAAR